MLNSKKQLSFHVLVDEQQGAFVATCLETSLVATSLDCDDAISKMEKLILRQIQFALKHDRLADIYHPAPKEVFDKYVHANSCCAASEELRAVAGQR